MVVFSDLMNNKKSPFFLGCLIFTGCTDPLVPLEEAVSSDPAVVVTAVGTVAPHILAVTLRSQTVEKGLRGPYAPIADTFQEPGGKTMPAWTPEGIAIVPKETRLRRFGEDPEEPEDLGIVYFPFPEFTPHLWREAINGDRMVAETLDIPAAFRLQSADDVRFGEGLAPVTVHRKSRPHDGNDITGEKVVEHFVYLVLPQALKEGATYTLSFPGLQPAVADVTYTHAPRKSVSEAIHVNHIGYRPDDPFKRAFLSLWMGSGGGLPYDVERFELIDAGTGETIFTGPVAKGFPADRAERFSTERNFVGADVHYLDFHEFSEPGNYRVHVPGVGVSLPFRIGAATWAAAFRTAMHGFLSHRSGIELGPPFSDYRRPRNMHPDDGFLVYPIPYTVLEGEAAIVRHAILEKLESGVPVEDWETVPDAWGGYMDAGDWDRRSMHLAASRHLAELFSLNPVYFESLDLDLPPEEADDGIPDILNEVMWNVAFYRRLQLPDGGVRGGIESTEHPRPGEASWEESLVIAAFAPDPFSSYSYAGAAALVAKALAPYDAKDAAAYAVSARRAWDWAEANAARVFAEAESRSARLPEEISRRFDRERAALNIRQMRLVAAGALFALEGADEHHEAFLALLPEGGDGHDEMGAYFNYARLPEAATDPAARATARERILAAAERAIQFGENNAFGLHTQTPGVPIMGYSGFYSVPEMITGPVLPRAYVLTGEKRFLRAAVKAAHFSAGANPLNTTFTTGVGHHYPSNPLHIDSRVSGQPPPNGITIYGPSDASADFRFTEWVHQWHLGDMVPGSRTWPAAEWHVDLFRWPAMSEYTIHQTFRPTAYYWGFLAAREEQ